MSLAEVPHSIYTYAPLDPAKREIRLLHLLAGPKYATSRCMLQTVSLDQQHPFDALSYAWGASQDRQPVNVDGKIAYVTQNLSLALDQFQSEIESGQEHILWIDAVYDQNLGPREKLEANALIDLYQPE
jgi:hypothetical protein